MQTGKVKFFNANKGYGFIIDDSNNKEVFVHATALNGLEINEGDRVEFNTDTNQKGIFAVNVNLAQ